MRKKVRFLLAGLLVADVLLIGYLMYDYIQNKIPDSVLTYVGEKQELDSWNSLKVVIDGMESEMAWSIMAKDVPEFMKEDSQRALSFEILDEE